MYAHYCMNDDYWPIGTITSFFQVTFPLKSLDFNMFYALQKKNKEDDTPIHLAIQHGCLEWADCTIILDFIVLALRSIGVIVNLTD